MSKVASNMQITNFAVINFNHPFGVMRSEKRFGTVLKRETIGNINVTGVEHLLVLQAKDPYPGFFCPDRGQSVECKEGTFFLPHANPVCCPEDDVCRLGLLATEKLGINTCLSFITIRGKLTRAFRLKETSSDRIAGAVGFFRDHGVEIQNYRRIPTHLSYIYIKSFQNLVRLADHIYRNQKLGNHYYLTIPAPVRWEVFEKIITYQKFSAEMKNFDAAIGYWLQTPQFIDFIRIYGPKLTLPQLTQIRESYLEIYTKVDKNEIVI